MMELKAKHPKMVMKNPVQRTGGGIEQVQADWTQTDETAVDYIKNKPDVFRFEIRGNLAVAEEDFPINLTCDTPAQEIVDAFNNGKELEPVLINTAYDKEKQFFGGFFTFNNTSFSYNLFQLFYFAPSNSQKFTKYKIVQKKDVWQITAREIVLTPIPAYENKNTIQLLASKPNWLYAPQWVDVEELAEPQLQADWNQENQEEVDYIKNKPTALSAFENDVGFITGEDKPTYNLHFVQWSASPAGGKFEFDTVPEDFQQVKELIINGKINLTRTFDLTYDPTTTLPADYATFPDYEFVGVSKLNNMVKIYKYQRIICFSGDKPILDTISFYMRDDLDTYWIYHTYIPLFQAIIIVRDDTWKTQPYPHAITFSSADNLWGKTNLANVKKAMAGFSSKFQFKLRVLTHGDNVWLDPVETVSAGSLPRFIGESEKLGKRIIVSFDDFTDDDNPTGTIDMEDLIDDTHINSLIDTKLGVVENGTY